jgi:hypothetical protein
MVEGTEKFSAWAGPAQKEVIVHPNVEKGLLVAKEGVCECVGMYLDVYSRMVD